MRKLIIVPGGGDPYKTEYEEAYSLIFDHNNHIHKYDSMEIIPLMGQLHNLETPWNCQLSKDLLINLIMKFENDTLIESFDIFARSGGCFVTLMALQKISPSKLSNITCYGPASFASIKCLFLTNFEKTKLEVLDKGLIIDETTFDSFVPFEELILDYNSTIPLQIGFGNDDTYSPWSFGKNIQKLIDNNNLQNIKVNYIIGHHVVDRQNKEYINMIF